VGLSASPTVSLSGAFSQLVDVGGAEVPGGRFVSLAKEGTQGDEEEEDHLRGAAKRAAAAADSVAAGTRARGATRQTTLDAHVTVIRAGKVGSGEAE